MFKSMALALRTESFLCKGPTHRRIHQRRNGVSHSSKNYFFSGEGDSPQLNRLQSHPSAARPIPHISKRGYAYMGRTRSEGACPVRLYPVIRALIPGPPAVGCIGMSYVIQSVKLTDSVQRASRAVRQAVRRQFRSPMSLTQVVTYRTSSDSDRRRRSTDTPPGEHRPARVDQRRCLERDRRR